MTTVERVNETLDAEAARDLTDRIRTTLTVAHDLIATAWTGSAWAALGYPTWDAYCGGEFAEARMVRLDREQRREIVAEMRQAGMSSRAIASGLGVDHSTVVRDDRASGADAPVATQITGVNGKTYAPRPPVVTTVASPPPPAVIPLTHTPPTTVAAFVANRDTGEVLSVDDWQAQEPTPDPVGDWLAGDPGASDRAYMRSFLSALGRSGEITQFDADRIGPLLTDLQLPSVLLLARAVSEYADRVVRARSGLRVINGGQR